MLVQGATLVTCDICEAPHRQRLPEGWTNTVYRVGLRDFIQYHKPACPAGFTPEQKATDE